MPTNLDVETCPRCGAPTPNARTKCGACGALLVAAPVPVSAGVHGGDDVTAPAPLAGEQFFAPAVLTHAVVVHAPPPAPKSKLFLLPLLLIPALVVGAVFALRPGPKHVATPKILAPTGPAAGIPTSLTAINRIEAESTRHIALQVVEQVGNGEITALQSTQPSYQWIMGDQPSTNQRAVSVGSVDGQVTVAVSSASRDFCAFGRWSDGATPTYVTVQNGASCRAIDAPATGWSNEPGGAASDLPDDQTG